MPDPRVALTVALGLTLLAVVLFWPVHGLVWRWARIPGAMKRARIEDALKHLYDCESRELPCTLPSLCGALGMSARRVPELVRRLEDMELIHSTGGRLRLTAEGRSYALRVIRIHRLWERYLAEQTGLDPAEWHATAERREHRTSPEQAEAMAARMGHPRYDPHGDPIPTASGEIAPPRGRPLTDLPVGVPAEIVHVEDEPEAVYAQLVAAGLHPGVRVRILDRSPGKVRFEADVEEVVLAPVLAGNLSVLPLPEEAAEGGRFDRLSGLGSGQQATVRGISAACRGAERRRMLDLGLVPGTVVRAELSSPGGDPTAYRVRGALIALRREQADHVHVERRPDGEAA